MSHHRSGTIRVPFPSSAAPLVKRPETPGPPDYSVESGAARGLPDLSSRSVRGPGSPAPRSPKTPLRANLASSSRSPSIDSIRALYRKHPHLFSRSTTNSLSPNKQDHTRPPKSPGTLRNTSGSSPTRAPCPRQATSSRPENSSHGNGQHAPTGVTHGVPADAAETDSDLVLMYPDFGPGFVSAEEPAPNLALEIVSRACDSEKWDLSSRDSSDGWNGHGRKLQLIISYNTSARVDLDLDLEPSLAVKDITFDCALAVRPRLNSSTAVSARRPLESYQVSYRGYTTPRDIRGELQPMKVEHGIHMDHKWHGPTLIKKANMQGTYEHRVEYCADVYIPIPSSLFARTDTRAFDIDIRAWISVANKAAVRFRKSERIHFSLLGRISARDDAVDCALMI